MAPNSDRVKGGDLTRDASFRILKDVVIEKCVKDWRGITEKLEDGTFKEIPFDKDILKQLFAHQKWEVVVSGIINAISAIDNTTEEAEAEVAGNLPAS